MREDPNQSESFKNSSAWKQQRYEEIFLVPPHTTQLPVELGMLNRKFVSNSLSSNERNRIFFRQNDNFADLTLISGADDLADGRSFGLLDFDHDGWTDIALMTLNAPRFKLYQNQLKNEFPIRRGIRVQLTGGQSDARPSDEYSNRDGIGAKVIIQFDSGKKIMLHRQAGEGYATQNSESLSIGMPPNDSIAKIDVKWPSGKQTTIDQPNIDEVIRIHEIEK